jgi:diacylglycerol kinase (ATP)
MKRIINAFFYSIDGLKSIWKDEAAFRQEIYLFCILLPIALIVDVTNIERIMLVASLLLVLIIEVLNSAIENAVDLATQNLENPTQTFAKKAKDMGSLAVLLAFLLLIVVWVGILFL